MTFAPCDDDDALHEECGVFGILDTDPTTQAAPLVAIGLHALQHRGQEAAGIVSCDATGEFQARHALGHVGEAFGNGHGGANHGSNHGAHALKGHMAIGHVRYATTGETALRNVQPLFADVDFGGFALAHNGNLTNARILRHALVQSGSLFRSTTDTEVIVHLIARDQGEIPQRLTAALKQVQGAYALVAMSQTCLIGVRDPHGVRPLVIGQLGTRTVLASETCALDIIGATFVRDVVPGEMVVVHRDGRLESLFPFAPVPPKFCIFEYIYFARPDSRLEGRSVYAARKAIGAVLAHESPVEADIVVPVPDSGVPSAIGYAEASGLPFDLGIIRSHYIGRTFIQPSDDIRHLGVRMKHNVNRAFIEGKRIILIDDSIVRGTTSRRIVEMIRAAGAREVHMRISSPPTKYSCFYGIDTPEDSQLLAHTHSVEQMRDILGVDSLAFTSLDGLYRALGETRRNATTPQFCDACFSGDYAIPLTDRHDHTFSSRVSYLNAADTQEA